MRKSPLSQPTKIGEIQTMTLTPLRFAGRLRVALTLVPIVTGAAIALLAPAAVTAQQTVERERQTWVLPDAQMLEISRDLRDRLGLFPEVRDFVVARLFFTADGGTVLEIESREEGQLLRERRILSPEALETFRDTLARQLGERSAPEAINREGRGGLVLGHTLLGLGYHGWAVPVALDVNSPRTAVAAYLLAAGASFALPYRLTRDRDVTDVHRTLSLYGGTRGIASGLLLGDILLGKDEGGDETTRARLSGGLVVSAVGSTLGFVAADRMRPSEGQAELWGAMGDAGFAAGAAMAYLTGPYQSKSVVIMDPWGSWEESRRRNRRGGHAITLAGQGLGIASGMWMGSRQDYATGDVSVLRSTIVLGVQTGASLASIGKAEDEGAVAAMLAGGLTTLALGDWMLGPRGLGTGEGLLVNAGHVAGSALALGLTYLLVDPSDNRESIFLTTSTLGGWAGAILVWRAVQPGDVRLPVVDRMSRTLDEWDVAIYPGGLSLRF
jgi:hypothetical protein